MKHLMIAFAITLSTLLPQKKANAAILMAAYGAPSGINIGLGVIGGLFVARGLYLYHKKDSENGFGWTASGALILLVDEHDLGLEEKLVSFAPTAPSQLISSIAKAINHRARITKIAKRGIKVVTLPEKQAHNILRDYNFLEKELQIKLFKIMTDQVRI